VGFEVSEAYLVADLLRRIHRFYGNHFDTDKTVGVIVPYRSQIAAIRAELEKLGIAALLDISIDTVERFQGSQRDVIIYSFAVSHVYQLDFLTASTYTDEHGHVIDRKLNVALTRARKQMIMVGNAQILRNNALFRQLIDAYSFNS
jgi:superfamily I DNA and/or RNA helicase